VSFEIVWSERALRRLGAIHLYVARDKPNAAELLALRIVTATEALRTHPQLGRAGAEPRLRELIVAGTPYIIVYRNPNQAYCDNDHMARGSAEEAMRVLEIAISIEMS
jgi:toxin ParE1/3/4